MKKLYTFFYVIICIFSGYSQELTRWPSDWLARQYLAPYPATDADYTFDGTYKIQPEDNMPYEYIRFWTINYKESGEVFELRYYEHPSQDNDSVLAFNGKLFFMEGYTFMPIPLSIFPVDKGNYLYCAGYCGGQAYSPNLNFIFDLTDRSNIRFLIYSNGNIDLEPVIGLYRGKICIVITNYKDGIDCSKLYSLEREGLVEVLDEKGRGIEIFYTWSPRDDAVTILKKHTPANPVLLDRESNPGIKPEIIPFKTGVQDMFQIEEEAGSAEVYEPERP